MQKIPREIGKKTYVEMWDLPGNLTTQQLQGCCYCCNARNAAGVDSRVAPTPPWCFSAAVQQATCKFQADGRTSAADKNARYSLLRRHTERRLIHSLVISLQSNVMNWAASEILRYIYAKHIVAKAAKRNINQNFLMPTSLLSASGYFGFAIILHTQCI